MTTLAEHVRKLFHESGEFASNARLTLAESQWLETVCNLYSLVADMENAAERSKGCLIELCIELEFRTKLLPKSDEESAVVFWVDARSIVTAIVEMVIGSETRSLKN